MEIMPDVRDGSALDKDRSKLGCQVRSQCIDIIIEVYLSVTLSDT